MKKKAQAQADKPETITADKLCALTGLSDRRHRQLAKEGCFPPPYRSEYQLVPTLQGLFKHYRELGAKKTGTLAEEKELKLRAERKLVEIALKKAEGEVMDAALVEREWSTVILVCRQKLLGLASKVAPRLAYAKDAAAMELEIQKDIEEALTELGKPMSYGGVSENNEPKE